MKQEQFSLYLDSDLNQWLTEQTEKEFMPSKNSLIIRILKKYRMQVEKQNQEEK